MVPIIDGKLYHFGPRGLYNGLVLLGDDETKSYWDHITGECVHGPMKGKKMDVFPIEYTNVKTALKKWPGINIALSRPPLIVRLLIPFISRYMQRGFLPPNLKRTMDKVNDRLPEMTNGLGVVIDNVQRFYPVERIKEEGGVIKDVLNGKSIIVIINPEDQIPYAFYNENSERPMQLFTRWYGFYLTFPNCEVYESVE